MRTPDFFLVGAPKCGTTALNDYLAAHPEIFMCPRKESHHFCADWSPSYLAARDEYLSLFADAKRERRLGEASVWYLYAPDAPPAIRDFCPAAQIIIMLRNPVDMIHALHGHRLFIGSEDIEDFADALAAEPARRQNCLLPQWPHPIPGLFYRDVARYTERVQRYFNTFGRENARVIIYDDFRDHTARVYQETCAWLGVDNAFRPAFRVVNPAKRIRSYQLRGLLDNPPAVLRRFGGPLLPRSLRHNLLRRLRRLNTKHTPRAPLDANLRRQLQNEFLPDIERLSELLGRDLTHWCRADAG
jgi:hypothetical protein